MSGDPPAEFLLIARHFRPLAGPGALDLGDDAAVVTPPSGRELVIAADAMIAGIHFLPDDPPETIGRKLLRVNLSDIAAMGAIPFAYLMTIAAPRDTPESWLAAFSSGLAADQTEFGVHLLGGDTTSIVGPIALSLTILGHVAPGEAIGRAGARAGDALFVTGTIGDGALGLAARRGELDDPDDYLRTRYWLPRPRLGLRLHGLASAMMDISDGLVQDVGHLCRAADVSAVIEAARVPLSAAARRAGPAWRPACLTGGDDYELVMAVRPERIDAVTAEAARSGLGFTRIGGFHAGPPGVTVLDEAGQEVHLPRHGWSHF